MNGMVGEVPTSGGDLWSQHH